MQQTSIKKQKQTPSSIQLNVWMRLKQTMNSTNKTNNKTQTKHRTENSNSKRENTPSKTLESKKGKQKQQKHTKH